jgi:hypothetical protein
MNIEFFFNYMLQNKTEVIKQALKADLPAMIVRALLLVSLICFAIFGVMIGSSHSLAQGAVSFVKLPLLFYVTGFICFPTLYIFLALLGVQTSFKGVAQFSLLALSIMSLILIAFAPVSLFFLVVKTDYQMFKLLNVGMMAIAGSSGVYLFSKYILANVPEDFSINQKAKAHLFIKLWLVMFALIGANLGFATSPIFGDPTQPFMLFTSANQNFFSHLISIFIH